MSSYDEAREAAARAYKSIKPVQYSVRNGDKLHKVAMDAAIDAFLHKLSADSEMVERVAKAIRDFRLSRDDDTLGTVIYETDWVKGATPRENLDDLDRIMRETARAAIAAMLAQEVKP